MDITCLLHFSALGSSLHSDARKGLRSCQTENHTQQIQLSPDTQHFTQALLPINAKLCHKLQGLLLPRIFSKWRTIMIYSPDKLNYHRLIKTYLNPRYPNQNLSPVFFFFFKAPHNPLQYNKCSIQDSFTIFSTHHLLKVKLFSTATTKECNFFQFVQSTFFSTFFTFLAYKN